MISCTLIGIGDVKANNELFTVGQNFPNPSNGVTAIPVNFKNSTDVKLTVVDLLGKVVFNQTFENIPAGSSQIDLNMGNLTSGVYVYSIEAEGFKTSRKMIVE
jgi:hypothetical protein